MKILTAEQMREADRLTSERYGVPNLQLMENAGTAIAEYLRETCSGPTGRNVLVLCGKGNNGGDGLVVARRLRESGAAPRVMLFAEPSAVRGDAAVNLKAWQEGGGELRVVTSLAEWEASRGALGEADVIVDALLGTGIKGPVEELLAQAIRDVNAARSRRGLASAAAFDSIRKNADSSSSRVLEGKDRGTPRNDTMGVLPKPVVVAVDMPSGLASGSEDYGGPVVEADATVTLTAPKAGQMLSPRADCVGQLIARQIGTPAALLEDDPNLKLHWLEPGEFRGLPLVRKRDANKGNFGHALVVAGSYGKSGAAALAGRAALRVGAGLVTVAIPAEALPIVAAGMPELMTAPLAATKQGAPSKENMESGRFAQLAEGKSVIGMGPGLTTQEETQELIRAIVETTPLPVVLDADGLNAFAGDAGRLSRRKTPLLAVTPHPGEMARLTGMSTREVQARRLEVALEAAARWRAYVILKGFHTILATPDGRVFVNTTGNAGMATAGTGDVLTGMLTGLTAEFGTDPWERVLGFGIYLHGLAGDIAAERVGEAPLVASDVIEALPEAFAQALRAIAAINRPG